MELKVNLIAATCENMGIGVKGTLPWRLKKEMAYFSRMTKETSQPDKKNVVLMGRKTWDSIPKNRKPLQDRINVVLSRQTMCLGNDVIVSPSLELALEKLQSPQLKEKIDTVWIIGGSSVYKECMDSPFCHRIYLTKIFKDFECDTFLPEVDTSKFMLVRDPRVPVEKQEENGLEYQYIIYEKLPV